MRKDAGSSLFLLVLSLLLFSCNKRNYPTTNNYNFTASDAKPDYTSLNYWAAHPWKKNLSDSLPAALQGTWRTDSSVDVFFIHPTTLTDTNDPRNNATIDDAELNEKTDYSTILYQASVFNEHARIFSPRYRQAHIRSFFIPDSVAAPYFEIAYADIRNAFLYYLEHYNNGRPIIIAAHSQGTLHAGRLLKEFFENKPLQKKLVCAYLIGMPVATDYFTALPPCKDSTSTGCFVSWRTFRTGYEGTDYVKKENFKTIVINPLTWAADTTKAAATLNKGGVLKKFSKIVPKVVSAQVHHNILWACKPDVPGKFLFTAKNFHVGDINLFYMNIRYNVAARIRAYLSQQH